MLKLKSTSMFSCSLIIVQLSFCPVRKSCTQSICMTAVVAELHVLTIRESLQLLFGCARVRNCVGHVCSPASQSLSQCHQFLIARAIILSVLSNNTLQRILHQPPLHQDAPWVFGSPSSKSNISLLRPCGVPNMIDSREIAVNHLSRLPSTLSI